jgi:hypothetical protein
VSRGGRRQTESTPRSVFNPTKMGTCVSPTDEQIFVESSCRTGIFMLKLGFGSGGPVQANTCIAKRRKIRKWSDVDHLSLDRSEPPKDVDLQYSGLHRSWFLLRSNAYLRLYGGSASNHSRTLIGGLAFLS